MPLVNFSTPALIKNEGNLPLTIDDAIIQPHLNKASAQIKRMISPALYDQFLLYSLDVVNPEHLRIFNDIQIAETNLSLAYLLPSFNMQPSSGTGGILKGKGWDMTRVDFYTFSELNILIKGYKDIAYSIIKIYIPVILDQNIDLDDFYLKDNFYLASI